MIYPCKCKAYNGGQCYNCLNGAHHICEARGGCKTKTRGIGLKIVFGKGKAKLKEELK